MSNLEAVIFDMNGTVLSDEGLYSESFKDVLADLGINEQFSLTKGISLYKNWQNLVIMFNIDDQKIEDLVERTQNKYKSKFDRAKIRSGFFELSEQLRREKIKRALATSNDKNITDFVFDFFKLDRYFDIIVTADDVNEVKPNPEIFLLAANLLKVDPANSVVFEDAQAGIDAAVAGGFKVIGIKQDQQLNNADMIVNDFAELSVAKLANLMLK